MLLFLSLVFILLYVLPKISIDLIQIAFVKKKLNASPIILDDKDYKKAGIYAIQKLKFSICSTIYETILFFCWICFGFFVLQDFAGKLFHNPFLYSLFFLMSFFLIYMITQIPLSFYLTMILDKKFGFTKTNFLLFLKDLLRGLLLTIVFSGLIGGVLIYFISNFKIWWIYGFIFVFLVILLINVLYPTVIAPIFNTFSPLEDESLKERIEGLLEEVDFKSNGIFVMDASKRDGRLNAYFGGLGKSKRVILFDTLLEKVSSDGLLAILGHELGHFKHKDIVKNLFFNAFFIFVLFMMMGCFSQEIIEGLGIGANSGSILAFVFLISPVFGFWMMPFIGYFSRKAEYSADDFSAKLFNKTTLANALVRIVNENKAFPYSHPIYVFFYYTHPPLLDRLRALEYQF